MSDLIGVLMLKRLETRVVQMDNILVFTSDYSVVKLADFGSTRKAGTLVRRRHELLPYCPPEVAEAVYNEGYHVTTGHDVWQFGILLFVLLTGTLPWQKADETIDRLYAPFYAWQQRRTSKIPAKFKDFTARLQRLFRRLLDPKEETRVPIQGKPQVPPGPTTSPTKSHQVPPSPTKSHQVPPQVPQQVPL